MSWTDSVLESFHRLQNGVGRLPAYAGIRHVKHNPEPLDIHGSSTVPCISNGNDVTHFGQHMILSLTSIISSVLTEPKGTDIESVAVALLLLGRNTTRLVRVAQTRTRGEKWGDRPGSNRRQPESQSGALPTELRPPLEEKL